MSIPTTTERLKVIQKRLGVDDDGILGPDTLTRMEFIIDEVLGPLEIEPVHNLVVSREGLEQIVQFEISSESYYKKRLSHPIWPKGYSGITIGIGYDLGYHLKTQIKKDWKGRISDTDLEGLADVSGLKGDAANAVLSSVNHIKIPLEVAKVVFYTSTLSKYAQMVRKAYPGVQELPADAQAMLLSLVFNRGIKMSGSKRREMKAIQSLVVTKDLNGIAEQIRLMKRLWNKSELPGLHIRRDKEAQMIANAEDGYKSSELVFI
jgi:GH24 family phage-related lysozyme (muramidase)